MQSVKKLKKVGVYTMTIKPNFRASLTDIVNGVTCPDMPAHVVKGVIDSGMLTKAQVVEHLGVQPNQLFRVSKTLTTKELRGLCDMALKNS